MKTRILWIIPLIAVMMAGITSATLTCVFDQAATTAGTGSTYLKGTAKNLSVTMSGWTSALENASTAIISASPCTISGALVYNQTLAGVNATYLNTTVNTLVMRDDTTCTFTMTVKNNTQNTLATCTRDYISDNTLPALTLSAPANLAIDTDGVVPFNYACANTSSATLFIESKSFAMTESSDVCTYTNPTTSKLTNGFQSWYIVASDGLNTTTSATTKVEIRKPGGLTTIGSTGTTGTSGTSGAGTQAGGTSSGGLAGNGLMALIVFAGIIYFFTGKKGKK